MSTVLVFGASGLLGASLVPALRALGHDVLRQGRSEHVELRLDPACRADVAAALDKIRPAAVVNLVAATNVDYCEKHPDYAWKANVAVVAAIADGIASLGGASAYRPHLVHVSTDQVYDGAGPHAEEEAHPINVYGITKFTGELLAEQSGATVLRTNFFGRSRCAGRESFSDWLVYNLRARNAITVFDDVRFSAVHIDTLCEFISRSIKSRMAGIFNAGCRDAVSKAEFSLALARALNLRTDQVKIGKSADVGLTARRPIDMSLRVERIESALNLQCPRMFNEIERTAKEYLNDQ